MFWNDIPTMFPSGLWSRSRKLAKNTCHGPKPTLLHLPFSSSTLLLFIVMSQHKSLQGPNGLVVKRNVLKRFERVELLRKRGQWKEGDRVAGLRKTTPDV